MLENSPQDMQQDAMMRPEDAGRGTDTVMAHMSLGEVVIPRAFLDDPDVMEMLQVLFQQHQADIAEFTVGDPANKINPETGYPEFGFFKSLFKVAKVAAPLAAAYFAPGIGAALNGGLGLGLTGASSIAGLGGAAGGLAGGLVSGGGLKGALKGAVLGGTGGYLANGGANELLGGTKVGNYLGLTDSGLASNDLANTLPGIGSPRDAALTGKVISGTQNTLAGSLGTSLTGGAAGGSSSFLPVAANIAGGLNQDAAIKKQKNQLLNANNQQLVNLDTFDPSGITSDPGYKFNLEQGQEGLNKQLAATGSLGSGRAIKAATEYNQNYASNAFNNYYQRWLQKVQGQNALIGAGGDINANATGAGAQNLSQSLSNALGAKVGQYGGNSLAGLTPAQLKALGLVA